MSSNKARKPSAARVTVENVNHPGYTTNVEKPKYDAVKACLPPDLFPGGAKAGWWTKTVQLDLEAKGVIVRGASSPLHWRRAR